MTFWKRVAGAMPDRRSYLTRLRTDGGPSHELLEQLDRHRVLTTDQLARLTSAPVRTTRYRLDRLHGAGLVEYARPGRETGSAPRHWWLTPAGARLVAGVAPAEGKRPSAMFAGHAAAIAEVWLAVCEHGPTVGITPVDWWPDRAGWQEWRPGPVGEPRRLTPDAVLTVQPPTTATGEATSTGRVAAFVEVDLATMSQTQLRAKVAHYLTYTDDRAWAGVWPNSPPLLLLTTTTARARTWIRAAGKLLTAHRRSRGPDWRFRGRDHGQIAHAERLVVAACGLVRDPATAVTDPVWMLPGDDPDHPDAIAATDLTLAGLLAERAAAQAAAAGWYARFDAEARRAARLAALYEIAHHEQLPDLLGDPIAAEALTRLIGDADQFAHQHPQLAEQLLTWWSHPGTRHHRGPGDAADSPGDDGCGVEAIRAGLRRQHERIWIQQARALLAAVADPQDANPGVDGLAAILAEGRLLRPWQLDTAGHGRPRTEVQATTWGTYPAHRDRQVEQHWQHLSRRERRRTSPADLAAAHDQAHLLICDTCAIAIPCQDEYANATREIGDDCWACGRGHLTGYHHRDQIPTLTDRLTTIYDRLTRRGG